MKYVSKRRGCCFEFEQLTSCTLYCRLGLPCTTVGMRDDMWLLVVVWNFGAVGGAVRHLEDVVCIEEVDICWEMIKLPLSEVDMRE